MKQPDIVEYPFRSTFRVYLDDWFTWRKATYGAPSRKGRVYSHRLFSRRIGLKSPGLLGNVIKGRRDLSRRMVELFLSELALSEVDASIFRVLVAHDQAAEEAVRKEEALADLPRDSTMSIRAQALLDRDTARLCHAEARDRLRFVMTFTLCQGPNRRLGSEEQDTISGYYGAISRRLLEVMQTLDVDSDQPPSLLRGLTLALSEASMPRVCQLIVTFLQGLMALRETSLGDGRVYQVSLQILPLTHSPTSGEGAET